MAMISAAGDLLEQCPGGPEGVEPSPVAVSPRRMKIAEKLATNSRLGAEHPAPAARLELADGDAGDGRQVAGDERQHAGGEERDEPGAEGREDADPRCRIALHVRNASQRGLSAS